MSHVNLIPIEINGIKTEVRDGITILEAARQMDISIPTLCHHKLLSAYGACRICLVEVTQGSRSELKTSCNNVVQSGMSIQTETERVIKSRKIILELLLARSPDSEKILELAGQYGVDKTRFPKKEKNCILCGLCVRMCQERMGKSVISFANRGTERIVIPPYGEKSETCQSCGACAYVCPAECVDLEEITDHPQRSIQSGFDAALSTRSPVYIPFPQAVPKLAVIDRERCVHMQTGNCGICSEVCEAQAIAYEQEDERIDLDVGAVILNPGYNEFQAETKGEFGFGRYANVMTNVQFDRMLSASGPFEGHVVRLSDGREAKRIAWIQCVGSRDDSCGNEYCSSVCCMVSTKQALVARDHVPGLAATIFYMDIRAHGKNFDQYYERARKEEGIDYVKSMPSRIVQMPGSKNLQLCFENDGSGRKKREFDMVVLSVGMQTSASVAECASRLGIELNEFGFCATDRFEPLETSRPGVYVAGAFQEPKDIPETVTQASGAAAMAMGLLASERNRLVTQQVYKNEKDITDEAPRIGVFVCHCGINIASVVDVEHVTEAVSNEPGVVLASHTMFTCSDASLSDIRDAIHDYRLNRIVVASCTPRTHEPLFRETLREAGLNPYLFELANIRDQCSWVHASAPERATQKAVDLVKMSIARARLLVPLAGSSVEVTQAGLVVGGGMSGMTAALSLADQGFMVHLAEISEHLGGNLRSINSTLEHQDISGFTDNLIRKVEDHPKISVYTGTGVKTISGHVGNFTIALSGKSEQKEISSGIIIVATGAEQAPASEYFYGESENVVTQIELERRLQEKKMSLEGKNMVMIQCVGSRNDDRPFCSRICCSMAVKNALKIKKESPDTNVFVLYRDIRTYGFRETYYKKAREAGVIFIRYTREAPPEVTDDNGLLVSVNSPDFPEAIEIETDTVVLSTGVQPAGSNKNLSEILKVPLNSDGFYVEAHLKLRPVDFINEGIYLCGLAHSPKFIDENIAQARAAASRASTILSKTTLDVDAQVSMVDQSRCISCMTCVKACPYSAPFVNKDHKAEIASVKCMGCGICAAECPARAIQLNHYNSAYFNSMIDELFSTHKEMDLEEAVIESNETAEITEGV